MNEIATTFYQVAKEYAERANTDAGVDSMIAGHICDAFRHVADELSQKPEESEKQDGAA